MVVDAGGRFMSQRTHPQMALIHTALSDESLLIQAANYSVLQVPLAVANSPPRIPVTIWRDHCFAHAVSDEADAWFSELLGGACRLVRQAASEPRVVDRRFAGAQDQTSFSDGFPFLLINETSVAALSLAAGQTLSVERFRANLLIRGAEAYAEDSWRHIQIGEVGFRLPKPCSRCVVPTIDPATGIKGSEPLRTLKNLRAWQGQVYFGQNALHDRTGTLRVGDPVAILQSGAPQPPFSQIS